jgi:hypothetical protein
VISRLSTRSLTGRRPGRSAAVAIAACALAGSALSFGGSHAAASANPTINVLSTRADLVSGGDALVSVTLPPATNPASVHMALNGGDITSLFAVRPNTLYEGLVTGLTLGANQLAAMIPGGAAHITITNHPIGGPVFSGPQVEPWVCEAGATDVQCDKPTAFALYYRSHDVSACQGGPALPISSPANASGCFLPYDPSNPPASGVPTTTTDNGHTVPYIIRIETGFQDRDQYKAAVLFTPNAAWQPWAPQPQWDTVLEVPGGSSCGEGHTTGSPPSVTDDTALSRGVLVADPALDNNGHN